ncbi:MAG: hypothetical protein P0S96_01685 [Simkaniaceae bacterium]|nr:hypothetical protein [Candidatus Sacchlamyda saccharinae]
MRKLFFLLFVSFASLYADDEYIVLQEEQVHEGDYFAAGKTVEVSGTVKGDVYVLGSQIIVDGHVLGSVIATGGSIEIAGTVDGNVRLAGGQIEINGNVGRNVTAIGANIQFVSKTLVGGNAVLTGGIVDVSGKINGDLTLSASNARLLGDVGRNVHAYAGEFRVGSKVDIGGNLDYSSSSEARIDSSARIGGEVNYEPSVITEVFEGKWRQGLIFGSRLTGILMNFAFSFFIGALFLKLFPRKLKRTIETLKAKPWKSFWMGVLILVLLPVACLLLFITILGFPIALALLAISLLGFYTAKIFPIFWVSNSFLPKINLKINSLLGLGIGLVLFFLLAQIPIFGKLLTMVFTLLGLGALFLSKTVRNKRK